MTGKQIEAAKKSLPRFNDRTTKNIRTADELSCREMINSCLIYGDPTAFYDESTGEFQEYAQSYVKDLGAKTVKRLWDEQLADFAKATVVFGVYTDCEGCCYNSCIWADERN